MSSWPCRCQEKFCLWLQNFKTSLSVFSAVCLLITLISLKISSAFLWLIKNLIDTVSSYLVFGHYVHPGKSHFRQQHQCCHWRGERGQLWHCIAVCAHYQQRKEISHTSHSFRREPFTIAKLQSANYNHYRCFFSQTYSATLKQLSLFAKKMHFLLSSGKLLAFRWVATSLKSLLLPSLSNTTIHKWELSEKDFCFIFFPNHYYFIHVSFSFTPD